jgi:hypothetical protein
VLSSASEADYSFENDSLFLLLMIRRLNSMNAVVASCAARLFYAVVSLVHIDAMRALLGGTNEIQGKQQQQQQQQQHQEEEHQHQQSEDDIISRLNAIIKSMSLAAECDVCPDAHEDALKFDAVRATTTASSLVSLWTSQSPSSCYTFNGCSSKPFAVTLLRVLQRALDESCPHDLLLMVTGIYSRLASVRVEGVLELFVGGSNGGKNVISVLEQLASSAIGRRSALPNVAGSELLERARFVKACVTIGHFCAELRACMWARGLSSVQLQELQRQNTLRLMREMHAQSRSKQAAKSDVQTFAEKP